jgi:hypothetical protein
MEQEKDVSEYLLEVNLQELNNCSLWTKIQEAASQPRETEFVLDMGTDIYNTDTASIKSESPESDILFYIQVDFIFELLLLANLTP